MKRTLQWMLLAALVVGALHASSQPRPTALQPPANDDLDEQQEKAIKAAVKEIAPCVVKIETSGGTEIVRGGGGKGAVRRGSGPTTGVIVSEDGYVITSSFNFANKPATIFVSLPGTKEKKVARVVALDQTRMLTLLKIVDLTPGTKLPVPRAAAKKGIAIGITAIAIGRTLTAELDSIPSVSVGIISALERIWGKAVQTDAKVSPTNYGGPLINLDGEVIGILVPASPQAEGELAGFEWYDSGIGFAIPLEDINAALPRLMKGTEKKPVILKRGYLGVTMKSNDMYEAEPIIENVAPGSAAEKAGLKRADKVLAVDGKSIRSYAQLMHRLGGKYVGDTISLKLLRDKAELTLDKVVLGSAEEVFPLAFLGILPIRDDPDPGVEVRYVYPKGPAEVAGVKEGDRIMKISSPLSPAAPLIAVTSRGQLAQVMEACRPNQDMKIEVKRKAGKTETLTLKASAMPDSVPEKLPAVSTAKKARGKQGPPVKKDNKEEKKAEKEEELEKGLFKKTTPAADNTYWVYVPEDYNANISYGVVVWLHPTGKNKEKDFEEFVGSWQTYCDDNNLILICPKSDNPRGWSPDQADFVQQALRTVSGTYTVDSRRVVAHGMGVGGEMALHLGFHARTLVRGVATVGSHLGSNPRERISNQPLSFFVATGNKDLIRPAAQQTKEKLEQFKYPVIYREINNMGHEYIDGRAGTPTLEELVRWIDSLDRM